MQTFVISGDPTYEESAEVLDLTRLGNQAYREGRTLINGGWPNHPASKMWRGYEHALARYCLACLRELWRRGRKYPEHIKFFLYKTAVLQNTGNPPWLGDERVHASHRSNLMRKNYEHYSRFGWTETTDMPYYWPVG